MISINNSMRLNRPLVRGEIRVFTKKRTYVLGRRLRPYRPGFTNPNFPWYGLWSYSRHPASNTDNDTRFHLGKKLGKKAP